MKCWVKLWYGEIEMFKDIFKWNGNSGTNFYSSIKFNANVCADVEICEFTKTQIKFIRRGTDKDMKVK